MNWLKILLIKLLMISIQISVIAQKTEIYHTYYDSEDSLKLLNTLKYDFQKNKTMINYPLHNFYEGEVQYCEIYKNDIFYIIKNFSKDSNIISIDTIFGNKYYSFSTDYNRKLYTCNIDFYRYNNFIYTVEKVFYCYADSLKLHQHIIKVFDLNNHLLCRKVIDYDPCCGDRIYEYIYFYNETLSGKKFDYLFKKLKKIKLRSSDISNKYNPYFIKYSVIFSIDYSPNEKKKQIQIIKYTYEGNNIYFSRKSYGYQTFKKDIFKLDLEKADKIECPFEDNYFLYFF